MVYILKSSTYKWIIGCLIGIIIILVTYLILKENAIICVSFSESLSLVSTISSLILSVIAMLYTYYSGRDTGNVSVQIQSTIKEIDRQVKKISDDTEKNSEVLIKMTDGIQLINQAIDLSTAAVDTFKKKEISEDDKQSVIENIKKSQSSMMMFLERMKSD